jgi:hypothetical protein
MTTCSVILGPRTRLGLELARALTDPPSQRILVARDERDRALLTELEPGAHIARHGEPVTQAIREFDRVEIYVCALGPIHPGDDAFDSHVESTSGGLAVIEDLLTRIPRVPTHLVHVSSVLARVAPRSARSYYAGFKNLAEGQLSRIVAAHGRSTMSVVHPGRLLTSRSVRRPTSLLQTTYRQLAQKLIRIAATERSVRAPVGLDARLFTVARSAAEACRAIIAH